MPPFLKSLEIDMAGSKCSDDIIGGLFSAFYFLGLIFRQIL